MVSRAFGQLVAMRHLTSGCDCAIPGAANAAPTIPTPPPAIRLRRRIAFLRFGLAQAGPLRRSYSGCRLEIPPPKVKGADRDADQHQAEGVLRVGQEAERDAIALGDA